jgi:hypothetical protein
MDVDGTGGIGDHRAAKPRQVALPSEKTAVEHDPMQVVTVNRRPLSSSARLPDDTAWDEV